MAEVTLRFVGRFVFAEPLVGDTPQGPVNALAMDMTFNPDVRATPHRYVMTAPRRLFAPDGCRPPDLILMSAEDPQISEYVVWDLEDLVVDVGGAGSFSWADRRKLADLNELGGSQFSEPFLYARGEGAACVGLVQLRTGSGTARQISEGAEYVFARLADVPRALEERERDDDGQTGGSADRTPLQLADLVDVAVTIPEGQTHLTLRVIPRGGGPISTIALGAEGKRPTVVCFSNLCSEGHGPADREFAGLYEALATPPLTPDRKVPIALRALGKLTDCYAPAYAAYRVG